EMIATYAPELSAEQVEQLALATRGLMRPDIDKNVDEFRQRGAISYHMAHPTNTCDPNTGNWSEHLMEFQWLEEVLHKAGFSVQFLPGLYYTHGSLPKKLVKVPLNIMLSIFGRKGMFFAPYYVVFADSQ